MVFFGRRKKNVIAGKSPMTPSAQRVWEKQVRDARQHISNAVPRGNIGTPDSSRNGYKSAYLKRQMTTTTGFTIGEDAFEENRDDGFSADYDDYTRGRDYDDYTGKDDEYHDQPYDYDYRESAHESSYQDQGGGYQHDSGQYQDYGESYQEQGYQDQGGGYHQYGEYGYNNQVESYQSGPSYQSYGSYNNYDRAMYEPQPNFNQMSPSRITMPTLGTFRKPNKSLGSSKKKGGKKKSKKKDHDIETFGEDPMPMPQARVDPVVTCLAAPFLVCGALVTFPCRFANNDTSLFGDLEICGNTSNARPTRRVQDLDVKTEDSSRVNKKNKNKREKSAFTKWSVHNSSSKLSGMPSRVPGNLTHDSISNISGLNTKKSMFGTPLESDSRYDYDSRMSGARSYEDGASMLLAQQWKVNDTFSRATTAGESQGYSVPYSNYDTQGSSQWENDYSRNIQRRRSVSFSRDTGTHFDEQNMRYSKSYEFDSRPSGQYTNENRPHSDPEYSSQQWGNTDSRAYSDSGAGYGSNQWQTKDSINGGRRNVYDSFSQSGAQNTEDSRNYGAKWNVNDTFSRSGVQGTTDDTRTGDNETYSRSDAGNGNWNVNDTFSKSGKEGPSDSTFNDRTFGDETDTQTRTSAGESYDDSTLPTEWEAQEV